MKAFKRDLCEHLLYMMTLMGFFSHMITGVHPNFAVLSRCCLILWRSFVDLGNQWIISVFVWNFKCYMTFIFPWRFFFCWKVFVNGKGVIRSNELEIKYNFFWSEEWMSLCKAAITSITLTILLTVFFVCCSIWWKVCYISDNNQPMNEHEKK